MAYSIFNNTAPASAQFASSMTPGVAHPDPYQAPPAWQKQPGYIPPLPSRAIPAPTNAARNLLNMLPSVLNFNIR